MNNNNFMYNNPYNQYPYTNYYNQQAMPQMQPPQYNNQVFNNQPLVPSQSNQQQMTQQPLIHPLIFVSGIEGAKAHIVAPGQTVYFLDSENNNEMLYIKTADKDGRYSFTQKRLVPLDENIKEEKIEEKNYVTLDELNALKQDFETKINKLSSQLEKRNKSENTSFKKENR